MLYGVEIWTLCRNQANEILVTEDGKNQLLFQYISKRIKWNVVSIEEFYFYLLHRIHSNILLSRMTPYANEIMGEFQCDFRRNRSTIGHIFSIRQILEKKKECNKGVCQLFIHLEKAYDPIRGTLYYMLIRFGLPKCVRLIKTCLDGTQSKVKIRNYMSSCFFIDVLSSQLFFILF